MTSVDPKVAQQLAAAVADTTQPAEPPRWVQGCQMLFAALCLAGGIAVALVLILHGPPAPKEAEATGETSSSATAKTHESGVALHPAPASAAVYVGTAGEEAAAAGSEGSVTCESSGGSECGESEPSESEPSQPEASESEPPDSLANLNEQAPWAFAIVALLVGAFLATGRSLNVLGVKREKEGP